jgi:flagellar protein FlaJ
MIPSSRANYRAMEIERELPFALRHLATELKAGVGIVSSFESIAKSDYGALSEEFNRIVQDIRKGKTTEEALRAASERTKSLSFKRAIMNFIRAVRTGGAISEIIGNIAKDTSYELNMKIRDFVEKLNMIGLIFIMVGVVVPVMISILGAITAANPSLPLSFVNGLFLVVVYGLSLFLVAMTIFFVKSIQPM